MRPRHAIVAGLLLLSGTATFARQAPAAGDAVVRDAAFDMYWRARLLGSYAGNRVCALPNSLYDDPASPYRPLDERMIAASVRFEARFPGMLNRTARPYQMPPPQQGRCDDDRAASQSLFAFETAIVALERLLDQPVGR